MLKTGACGLMRFAIPLFPDASATIAPAAMWLGVAGIIYGAILAFAQTDFKRMVAYTSVSHLGFVLLGIYSGNPLALQGAAMRDNRPRHLHRRCSYLPECFRAYAPRATSASSAGCGRRPPRWEGSRFCSLSWHWACRGWGTSSASSWCSSGVQ